MTDSTCYAVTQPDASATDRLHELLRKGARDLIAKAVEAELNTFLEQYADKTLPDGRRAAVRNGYLPERTVMRHASKQKPSWRMHGSILNTPVRARALPCL